MAEEEAKKVEPEVPAACEETPKVEEPPVEECSKDVTEEKALVPVDPPVEEKVEEECKALAIVESNLLLCLSYGTSMWLFYTKFHLI